VAGVDSYDFRLALGTDTIWRQRGTSPTCPVPDSMFIYGRSYKWLVRAHNQFGWGKNSVTWSFWVRFNNTGVEETSQLRPTPVLRAKSIVRSSEGRVAFCLAGVAGGRLTIYDATGSKVTELAVAGGAAAWDLRDRLDRVAGAGLYFARFESGATVLTRRFILTD